MAKRMTKAAARKRLKEALNKVKDVYLNAGFTAESNTGISTPDMGAFEKLINKNIKRFK